MRAELFVLEKGVFIASDPEEVSATFEAMEEFGIARLPYKHVTVRLPATEFLRFKDKSDRGINERAKHIYVDITISDPIRTEKGWVSVECPKCEAVNAVNGFRIDITDTMQIKNLTEADVDDADGRRDWTDAKYDKLIAIQEQVRQFLIVMLATRNVRKTTTVDKLARLGIGSKNKKSKHRYSHITTISLPRPEDMEDDHEHKPTGQTRAPHLRRGHVRNQHYGPKGAYVKRIWIEPVFVNADPDFVSKREAYNVVTA